MLTVDVAALSSKVPCPVEVGHAEIPGLLLGACDRHLGVSLATLRDVVQLLVVRILSAPLVAAARVEHKERPGVLGGSIDSPTFGLAPLGCSLST